MLDIIWDGEDLADSRIVDLPSEDWLLYQALVTGVRDYFAKTGFKRLCSDYQEALIQR